MKGLIGCAVLGLLYVPQLPTISATCPAMFPTHVRYAGFAIAYNMSTSLFGGTAPAVNDWLVARTVRRSLRLPAYYMMGASWCTSCYLLVTSGCRETDAR